MADTPGYILKNKRESKNLNIAQVAKLTRIRAVYIQAMEADDFASLPSPVHARGFLRVYADFIGLDPVDLIANLASDFKSSNSETIVNTSGLEDNSKSDNPVLNVPKPTRSKKQEVLTIKSNDNLDDLPGENAANFDDEISQIPEQLNFSPSQSKIIFSSIGNRLRMQREELGLSLNEVEKHSHVLKRYLELIEAGEFENLPSSVQSRGMLTNYARFLELDTDEILLKFAEGLQAQLLERQQPDPRRSRSANDSRKIFTTLKRFISIDLVFGSGLIILLIVFAVWGTGKVIDLYNNPASISNAESISDIILTPIQTVTAEILESTQTTPIATSSLEVDATEILDIPANVQGQVQVYVVVLQRTWLRISVDNKILLEGRVEPGNAYSFYGNNQVEVLTGNGAGLQIIHNQADLGIMGVFGEIVDNIYTPNSIIKPTATITSTPTITPIPSLTPRVTSTPLP